MKLKVFFLEINIYVESKGVNAYWIAKRELCNTLWTRGEIRRYNENGKPKRLSKKFYQRTAAIINESKKSHFLNIK